MSHLKRHLVTGLAALLLLFVVTSVLPPARTWIDHSFPGFLLLENRVVASVGLERWPATRGGELFQREIVALDGAPVADAETLLATVRALPPGTPVRYTLRHGDRTFERVIPTQRFLAADFALLFGLYLLNGLAMGGTALFLLTRQSVAARAAAPLLYVGALWGLTAIDLYGPYHLFRLHALSEVLLFPAALHMALAFPAPLVGVRRRRWLTAAPYVFAAGLAVVYQLGLQSPSSYVLSHLLATSLMGVALVVLLASQLLRFFWPPSPTARRQLAVLALGALVAVVLPACLTAAELHTGGRMPQNAVAFTAFLLPLSIAWAAAREPLAWTSGAAPEKGV
jgi:hypothetical protein